MLDRIELIQGVGLLHDANGKPHSCQRATLVYADNGRGKSTLATVLRSAATGDPTLVSHRRTVDGVLPPKVTLQFSNGHKVNFSANAWSESRPEVLVFDADFVERNVHSGGAVSTGHRKNLLEFALGEAAVAARTAVEQATADARAATEKVLSLTGQLSGHHTGLTLPQFEALTKVAEVDVEVAALQKRVSAANNAAAIIAKPVPAPAPEPSFDFDGLFAALESSLKNVHADAERVVKEHVAKLGGGTAESWLSQGQQLGDAESCPYCGQATTSLNLIRAYQTHFNEAYAALKVKVAGLRNVAEIGTRANIVERFLQAVVTAKTQATAWSELVPTQAIDFDASAAGTCIAELQDLVLKLVARKEAAPADPVSVEAERPQAVALWVNMIAAMTAANGAIKSAADAIGNYKGQLAAENVLLLTQQIQRLEASKRRHGAVVVDLISKIAVARSDANKAEDKKKSERDKLDGLMTATLSQYEKSINTLLKNFGASFSIKGMGANFRGAAPRTEYGLSLRGKDIALEGGQPSFSTALSEGDKRTLAFAFFVASTLADSKLSTRIVVIDDPMCSLDLNRKHHTRSVLKRLHSKAEQLILLAHDPYFLRDLRDALRKEDPGTPIAMFQLSLAANDYTGFSTLDVDKECESAYFQHHRLLNEFVAGLNPDAKAVAKAVRPMLEGYLHRRFPSLISKSLMFGQVVVCIRDAPFNSPLSHAKNLVAELNDINEYAGQFHHDTNAAAETVAVLAAELKTYVDRSLHLVHGGVPLS